MTELRSINEFLSSPNFALVGVSRNEKKFGNYVYKGMKEKGFNLLPIHSEMKSYDGVPCFPSLKEAGEVSAVISVVNKNKTLNVLKEAHSQGISKVWIQQGTDTPEAIAFANVNKMEIIKGECIMMFTTGEEFPHRFHRFFVKLFGSYPK